MAPEGRRHGRRGTRGGPQDEAVFRWEPDRGLLPCTGNEGPLLVADSWLVANGGVRGLRRHQGRFFRACAEVGVVSREDLRAFFRAAIQELPRRGRVFPRLELWGGPPAALGLRIRPAPQRGTSARLWVSNEPDPRTTPRRKGPDLDRLAALRARASAAGADEALLTTPSGLVLEATHSSLVWWEGPCLCVPSPALRVLPSVTVALIREIAARSHVPFEHRRRRVRDLHGVEAWVVNALHGIRPVSSWAGQPIVAGPPLRASGWQTRLEAGAQPLSTYSD